MTNLIAFYLPQYHPIPENDAWWGKGFTEWTNVKKAKPMFPGHYQPHIPADLGYYDLRDPDVRQAQADLAKKYGIHGFCYYHYWFNGKRLLERPFNEVLESGKPDFPFCLCWANESWTGSWNGKPEMLLIEQTYPGTNDYINHFYSILPALKDPRYISINGMPIFIIYKPMNLPNSRQFLDLWRELAIKEGLRGINFLGLDYSGNWDFKSKGYDGAILNDLTIVVNNINQNDNQINLKSLVKKIPDLYKLLKRLKKRPSVYSYQLFINEAITVFDNIIYNQFPSLLSNWDNTPRYGINGNVIDGSTPALFKSYLRSVLLKTLQKEQEYQIVFIKSWNEWAEGNYIEPDLRFGEEYLISIKEILDNLMT